MKAAVAYDNGNVAQDFSKARQFMIYDFEKGAVTGSDLKALERPGTAMNLLRNENVQALICGKIVGCMQLPLADANIHLFAGVSGSAEEAAKACAERKLRHDPLAISNESGGCSGCSGCGG